MDVCIFLAQPSRRVSSIQDLLDNLNAVTGWDMSMYELLNVGEMATVLARQFNASCGITSADEDLPKRCFEPIGNGPLEGVSMDREQFLRARELYYQITRITSYNVCYTKLLRNSCRAFINKKY